MNWKDRWNYILLLLGIKNLDKSLKGLDKTQSDLKLVVKFEQDRQVDIQTGIDNLETGLFLSQNKETRARNVRANVRNLLDL